MITLGIIGVVAALTLPTLIEDYSKTVVETRLKKFYSAINQAVLMAENDYGDKKSWWNNYAGASFDKDGNPVEGTSDAEKWFNKYLMPYLKTVSTKTLSDGTFLVQFEDGSSLGMLQHETTADWTFYPGNADKCIEVYGKTNKQSTLGICAFAFIFQPTNTKPGWANEIYHYNKGFEPYKYQYDGNINTLYNGRFGCNVQNSSNPAFNSYCTAIIQLNNWKIPNNYPKKIKYFF